MPRNMDLVYIVLELQNEGGLGMACFSSRRRAVQFAIEQAGLNHHHQQYTDVLMDSTQVQVGNRIIYKRGYR